MKNQKITKVSIRAAGKDSITVPVMHEILTHQLRGPTIVMWLLVAVPEAGIVEETITRNFVIAETGDILEMDESEHIHYIASFINKDTEIHLFEFFDNLQKQ